MSRVGLDNLATNTLTPLPTLKSRTTNQPSKHQNTTDLPFRLVYPTHPSSLFIPSLALPHPLLPPSLLPRKRKKEIEPRPRLLAGSVLLMVGAKNGKMPTGRMEVGG